VRGEAPNRGVVRPDVTEVTAWRVSSRVKPKYEDRQYNNRNNTRYSDVPWESCGQAARALLLASLGKRVLRPGGLELTQRLLKELNASADDRIVELAPGVGITAQFVLQVKPMSYTGIERDARAADRLRDRLAAPHVQIRTASAKNTELPTGCASLVYGEAMLSMQTPAQKRRIVQEAYRLLEPGGRYGIHELALVPENIDGDARKHIERETSMNIHAGVRPVTLGEWESLLREAGFQVRWSCTAAMNLLEPRRVLADEGLAGVLQIVFNMVRKPEARRRVLSMRRMFQRFESNLKAVSLVCVRP
jgi:SAM-dependent methyltransferase